MSQTSDQFADTIIGSRRTENERQLELELQRAEMWHELFRRPNQP